MMLPALLDALRDTEGEVAGFFASMSDADFARQPAGGWTPAESQDTATHKADLLARWARVNGRLRDALGAWSERNLDRVLLPHPILGRSPRASWRSSRFITAVIT